MAFSNRAEPALQIELRLERVMSGFGVHRRVHCLKVTAYGLQVFVGDELRRVAYHMHDAVLDVCVGKDRPHCIGIKNSFCSTSLLPF